MGRDVLYLLLGIAILIITVLIVVILRTQLSIVEATSKIQVHTQMLYDKFDTAKDGDVIEFYP